MTVGEAQDGTDDGGVLLADTARSSHIGRLNESTLHAQIKDWCALPGDALEQEVDGYVVDLLRGDRIIEVQTGSFGALRPKLEALLPVRPVHVVYPAIAEKTIVRLTPEGDAVLYRRRSPRRGTLLDVFDELVRIAPLLAHPNLTLQVLLVRAEEWRCADGRGSWRRRGVSIVDRRLLEVLESRLFPDALDLSALLPHDLARTFTNKDLAACTGLPVRSAQRMTYCLVRAGVLRREGRRSRALVYARPEAALRVD